MTDPCWLPSAIMQTTAAILGLFAIVYILTVDRFGGMKNIYRDSPIFKIADGSFIILLSVSIWTIFINAVWLGNLSVDVFYCGFPYIELVAMTSFTTTLMMVILYTLILLMENDYLRKCVVCFPWVMDKAKRHQNDLTKDEKRALFFMGWENYLKELGVDIENED